MEKLKRVVIKEELVELTGSYKLALVLNQFLYWTERVGIKRYKKFEKEETNRKEGEIDNLEGGWIYKTSEELSKELMIDVTETTIRRYIKKLKDQGYIIERKNPKVKFDQTKQYRILLLELKNDLNELGYELQGYKYTDKAYGSTNPHNEDCNSNNEDCNSNNVGAIPESTTESTTEKKDTLGEDSPLPTLSNLKRKDNNRRNYPNKFEEVWNEYPKQGRKKKSTSYKKYRARINEDIKHKTLLTAATNYHKYCKVNNKTKYVKHCKTFFGPGDHWIDYTSDNFKDKENKNTPDHVNWI